MTPHMRNPGVQAGVSGNALGNGLLGLSTLFDWRSQMLVSRFGLSPWRARETMRLCFGEGADD